MHPYYLHLFAYLLDWTDYCLIGDIPFRVSTKMSLHNEYKSSHILSANISVPYIMMPILSNKMFCWMFLSPLVELIALSPSIRLSFKLQSVSDQWKCMKWPSVNIQASVLGCVLCNAVCVAGFEDSEVWSNMFFTMVHLCVIWGTSECSRSGFEHSDPGRLHQPVRVILT